MKRCTVLLVLMIIIGFVPLSYGKVVEMAVMTTADLQSQLSPYNVTVGGREIPVGGLERVAALSRKIRREVEGALLVSTGDDLMGAVYDVFKGKAEMRAMSAAGYDVVTPGNHEFDLGVEVYKQALQCARFDVVSANFNAADETLKEKIVPSVMKTIAGIKVGIFGLMTPDLHRICNVGGAIEVERDLTDVAKRVIATLRDVGCELIIALTHIGTPLDEDLARSVQGIHIIVGGHSHEYVYKTIDGPEGWRTVVVQAGARGERLGVLRFTLAEGRVQNPRWQTILLDESVGADEGVRRLIERYTARLEKEFSRLVGLSKIELEARKKAIRTGETNLGNLIADSWRDWFEDVEIALVNGGSIRGDRAYPAGGISYWTLMEMLPFRNTVVKVKMKGKDLHRLLEIGASALRVEGDGCGKENRAPSGAFLQVSGIKLTIDLQRPPFCAKYRGRDVERVLNPGSRVQKIYVEKDGSWEPVAPEGVYIIALNNWMANGGDGYYLLRDVPAEDTTMLTLDLLMAYLRKHRSVEPQVEGRITLQDPPHSQP